MFCYWTYLIPNWFDDKVSTFPFSDIQKQENPVGIAKYDRFLEEILLASLTCKSCWIARLIRQFVFFLMLDIKMVGIDKLSGTMVYN